MLDCSDHSIQAKSGLAVNPSLASVAGGTSMSFKDKVVVITGGRGMGKAMAEAFAALRGREGGFAHHH
jgi:hypothetical protein